MSNMIIFSPLRIAAVAVPPAWTGASNLLTPDPKEVVATMSGPGFGDIDIDMGAAVTVDALYLGGMTSGSYLYQFLRATGMGSGLVSLAFPAAPTNAAPHGFVKLAAPVTSRYFRLTLGTPVNALTLGIIALGLSFQPTHNREWGGGRGVVDTGGKESLLGGGFGIGEGARKANYSWIFGDLLDTEVEALWALAVDRGETGAVVVVEDPDETPGLNRRLHYGLFNRLEPYARQSPNRTRWALSMEEWI